VGLFAGIARSGRALGASAGGCFELTAATSDAKGGDQFFKAIVSADFAENIFFSADGDKGFEMFPTFFA